MEYTEKELEDLIKENTRCRKIHVFDTSWQHNCSAIFVDTFSSNYKKARKIAEYLLHELGYNSTIIDGYEGLPTDENHPEWLIVDAYRGDI